MKLLVTGNNNITIKEQQKNNLKFKIRPISSLISNSFLNFDQNLNTKTEDMASIALCLTNQTAHVL